MPPQPADVTALRRIALLANRVGEDDPTLRRATREISLLLDQLKRDVALSRPFAARDVDKLRRLLVRLSLRAPRGSALEKAMVDELRDLSESFHAA